MYGAFQRRGVLAGGPGGAGHFAARMPIQFMYTGSSVPQGRTRAILETRRRLKQFLDKHIDYRGAVAGATVLGALVFYVNSDHGWAGATTAALKQAIYTFFAGGYMMRLNERLSLAVNPAPLGVLAGVLGAGGLAVLLTYGVHSLKGTPEPLNSTLPTMALVIFGFTVLGTWNRYKLARDSRRRDTV